ncbi:peroxisome assembly factor 2 [Venturia canescens]|uniref:peroxisome assembly factor 2 n=1 Tax=Venturia canescens TaxID=32260 RepID=UPI001C9CBC6B|nr:peroxisome assembly factor 2 [Venturia canescens]
MNQQTRNLIFLLSLTKSLLRNNPYYKIVWLFMKYARRKFDRLMNNQQLISPVPDEILERVVEQNNDNDNPGYECCALASCTDIAIKGWQIICSNVSQKKYKIFVIPCDNWPNKGVFVSETMKHNIEQKLGHKLKEQSYFVMPIKDETILIATEANVSLVSDVHGNSTEFVDSLLKTYFKVPRYMKIGDLFVVDSKKYAPDDFYSGKNYPFKVHFRVNALKVKNGNTVERIHEAYLVQENTTLMQSPNAFSYRPREVLERPKFQSGLPVDLCIEISSAANCPPFLQTKLKVLSECTLPFIQKDKKLKIRPVFLVKGAPGSGKFKLIECMAKRNGFNLVNVDFSEIQCSSAAQTEAKLRIVLQNARSSVPCILRLSNIQIFGKNAEGKKDERIISAFALELEKLADSESEFPVIIIATLENDELEADVERLFIETISIEHPNKMERAEMLSWLLKTKGLLYQGNLITIAGSVSDFEFADLEALVLQSVKIAYQSLPVEERGSRLTLNEDHFLQACELMQSAFSDRVGAPRIPKVYWEDIGGLANLKHEIKRRIELPMLNTMGLGRSGILLHGPPGTGKTLLAKAVATECQLHFMSVKGPELLNMYVGQSEKNIRQVFERARAAAPCVIFFDELDSLAPNRGRSGDSGGVMDRVVSQLLAEMDGLESAGSIFIIGATNRFDLIDPALLRPGRFDKMLYVGVYNDRDSQLSVLRAVTRRFRLKNNGDELEEIVDKLPKNLTGADLYAVCSDAWLLAVRRYFKNLESVDTDEIAKQELAEDGCRNGVIVELEDFLDAAKNLAPSLSAAELAHYEKLGMEFSSAR